MNIIARTQSELTRYMEHQRECITFAGILSTTLPKSSFANYFAILSTPSGNFFICIVYTLK